MAVAQWILPHLSRRPLSLLRCPEGLAEECFFQKHPEKTFTREVPRVAVPEKQGGTSNYVYVSSVTELVWLVQYGACSNFTHGDAGWMTWNGRIPSFSISIQARTWPGV